MKYLLNLENHLEPYALPIMIGCAVTLCLLLWVNERFLKRRILRDLEGSNKN